MIPTTRDRATLIVRQGRIVTPNGIVTSDLRVDRGRIAEIAPRIALSVEHEINAHGAFVFPGIIDAHVHFNEPGRAEWEGLATGSSALAAGGATAFFDMPLNSEPPVLDATRLKEKRDLAEEKSRLDFALWGGLTPLNLKELAGLRDAGAIGLKAFMSASGIESFPRVDRATLREGMQRAAELGLLVAVHAEDEGLAAKFTAAQKAAGHTDAAAWLASRPVDAELAAIGMATELAAETGCRLHIVHVSSPEGVALVTDARQRRVDVTAETCPHYLLLNDADVAAIGAAAKCAPPIRDESNRRALIDRVRAGAIHTIGSDHSPSPADLKTSADFFALWGGIAGCQHGFSLLFSKVAETAERDLPVLASLLAANVARRFGLDRTKGLLAEGRDADFTLFTYGPPRPIAAEELLTKHRLSPYVGRTTRTLISHTFVRGRAVYAEGQLVEPAPRGLFLRPA